jgi:hypothetical protein
MKDYATIFAVLILALLLSACSKPGPAVSAKNDIDYYTCTMHPWVHDVPEGKWEKHGKGTFSAEVAKPMGDDARVSAAGVNYELDRTSPAKQ